MSEPSLLPRGRAASIFDKSLWLGGRVFHLIPPNHVITIPLGMNRGRRWLRGAANAPEWMGIYEFGKQRALRGLVGPGMTVWDIGANAGFYSLGFARLVGEAGRVLAFEPLPRNAAKIRRHLELNNAGNVTLHECALSNRNGVIRFAQGESDFTGMISEDDGELEVASYRLDDFLREHPEDEPSVLKIDVEGAEVAVLSGAEQLITRAHPTLLLALHGAEERRECFEILRAAGYDITHLSGEVILHAESMPDEVIAIFPGKSDV